ncbi:GAF and ANTAR domain-containing protein [Haloechinothrix halophila]|uniref:GAF and ANTAR domain-containing protein n=1 Tax=Haloechinothrix halophila TaxID=1069073 RepID=UPI00041B2807|nr:GAF and ANTAR domain-containing protein [Haloechinothrix halophila]
MNDSPLEGAVREQRLVSAFVEMADTLVDDYDIVDVLYRLADHCVTLLGAAAAGLLLADQRGSIQVVATSSERARLLELFQLQADEGPCLDAYRTGEVIEVVDLSAAKWRWPVFAPEALAEGFRSIQAVPMRLRGQIIGALNLFGRETGPLSGQDLEVARALADTATIGILQERAIRRGEVLTEQMQGALTSRVIIEQAKGLLSQAATISTEEAFEKLRNYSRNNNVKLSHVAEQLMRGEVRIDAL